MKLLQKYYLKFMDLSSTIKDTWKVFILGTIISCLLILLLLNENGQKTSIISLSTLSFLQKTTNFTLPLKSNTLSLAPQPSIASIVAKAPLGLVAPPPIYVGESLEKKDLILSVKNNGEVKQDISVEKLRGKKCDMFDGKWVYKVDAKPSYCVLKCPFVEEKMSCQNNGRPDFEYEKWVWEARDCDIPMLNGTDMLERFRNKRVVFVGDSLNRNMWESLACILYTSIPYPSINAEVLFESAHVKTFMKAKGEYNFTLEFYWSPYLVEQNKNHSSGKKVLVLDKMSPNSESWIGADILIFNTGMHWIQIPPKRGWEFFEHKGKLTNDLLLPQAYLLAMRTWRKWVQENVDPNKTKVFYRSISTEHVSPQYNQWCYGQTQPMMDDSYRSHFPKALVQVIENVISGMKNPQVTYLNVTKLSQYRIDAHPSVYRSKDWKNLSKLYKDNLSSYADCGHWCLPGLPDTWNRLFYASLVLES